MEGHIYQPSPLVGEGKGEGDNGLLQEPNLFINKKGEKNG